MRYRKMLGFAVIASMVGVVFVSTGSAFAGPTELYEGHKTQSSGLTVQVSLKAGTTLLIAATEEGAISTCKNSTIHGTTSNTKANDVTLPLSSATYGECTWATATIEKGSLDLTYIGDANGDGQGDGTIIGTGNLVTFKAYNLVTCLYGTGYSAHLGKLYGSTAGHALIDISTTILEQGEKKALCPDTIWDAEYVVTSPTGVNVHSRETELFAGSTTLEKDAAINASLKTGTTALLTDTEGGATDTCKTGTVVGNTTNTTAHEVAGEITSLEFAECTWATTTIEKGSLDITHIGDANGDGQGDGTITGTDSLVTVKAFNLVDCFYGTGTDTHLGTVFGSATGHALIDISTTILEQGEKKSALPGHHHLGCGIRGDKSDRPQRPRIADVESSDVLHGTGRHSFPAESPVRP